MDSQRRQFLRHGFTFLFLALWLGIATAVLPHPRAWLSAHVTAFLTALVLVAVGLAWRELRLTERQRSIARVTAYLSAYVGLAGNVFAAIVDLPGPASAPGVTPPNPDAAIFYTLLAIIVPSTLTSFGLVMYGMRGEP